MATSMSVYLEMCECGQHGRFVTLGGVAQGEFSSRDDARLELEHLLEIGKINRNEEKFLLACICQEEGLATYRRDVSRIGLLACPIMRAPFVEVIEALDESEALPYSPPLSVH